ncbi:MAG: hypothetical protein QOF99_7895, partial [Pseudonocardiales bacterium]|nr:hypothetical protein [Pseudonocardiales bacterium]
MCTGNLAAHDDAPQPPMTLRNHFQPSKRS